MNISVIVLLEPGGVSTEFTDVLYQPLLERSKGGAHEEQSGNMAKSMKAAEPDSSSLSVVSELMVKIINTRRPKPRYVAGTFGREMLMMRHFLSDRIFDRVIVGSLNRIMARAQ